MNSVAGKTTGVALVELEGGILASAPALAQASDFIALLREVR